MPFASETVTPSYRGDRANDSDSKIKPARYRA